MRGGDASFGQRNWATALDDAATLASGACGLSDGSTAGTWRLPSVNEVQSLVDYQYYGPALSNAAGTAAWSEGDAFSGDQPIDHRSSSSYAATPPSARFVFFNDGRVYPTAKTSDWYVWPVRGGQ